MFVLTLLFILLVVFLVCWYAGWGLSRLCLPAPLASYQHLLALPIGFAYATWLGYIGVSTVLNARWSLLIVGATATALNLVAWRRTGPPHLRWQRSDAALLAVLVLTLLAGVWPLVSYGFFTSIGQGWDTEAYLPMAQHLIDFPVSQIDNAARNPMRSLVNSPPAIGLTLAHSLMQAYTMLLSGQDALATFAPLQAVLRTLGVLAAYVWLRATMGLQPRYALAASALLAAGPLLLWVGFFNFGMQYASLPLIPLALTLSVAAVSYAADDLRRAWPALLLAALALAALPVAYYPALSVVAPLAMALGAVLLLAAWQQRGWRGVGAQLGAASALLVITAVLAFPTVRDYFEGFSFRYSVPGQKIGPERFIVTTDILGLTAFRLPGGGNQPPNLLVWAGALLAGVLLLGLLVPTRPRDAALLERVRWAGVLAAVVGALAWQRYGKPFEYGYMKSAAYAGMVLWGAVAAGAQGWANRGATRARLALAGLVVPLTGAIWAQALVVGEHARGPAIFTRDMAAARELVPRLEPGSSVLISNDPSFIGPQSGLYTILFYGHDIWGHLTTAYQNYDYWPEGELPRYALLAAGEQPWPLDVGGREVWRSGAAALYAFDPAVQVLDGRMARYSDAPPANRNAPAELAIWRRSGAYREARPDAPLAVAFGGTLRFGSELTGNAGPRSIAITVVSLLPQTLSISGDGVNQRIALPAGQSTVALNDVAPQVALLTPEAPLAVVRVVAREQPTAASTPDIGAWVWQPVIAQQDQTLTLRMNAANPGNHALRLGFTLVENTFSQPRRPLDLLAALPPSGAWELAFVPRDGALEARLDGVAVPLLRADAAPAEDGDYVGLFTVYSGEQPISQSPLLTLAMRDGVLASVEVQPYTLEVAQVGVPAALPGTSTALMQQPVALDGTVLRLEQALLSSPTTTAGPPALRLMAGDRPTVQLYWQGGGALPQPLMVSVQVLAADDRKVAQWDGVLGGDWRPATGWQPGERVRQDVPLAIDQAAPAGEYRLVLVAYDPQTGAAQPFANQGALELGRFVLGAP